MTVMYQEEYERRIRAERERDAALDLQKAYFDRCEQLHAELAAAQEALANLRKEYENSIAAWTGIEEERKAAEALAEQNAKDAERYRWLRDDADLGRTPWITDGLDANGAATVLEMAVADAAIDAAKESK